MGSVTEMESAYEYGRCSGCFRNHQLPPFSLRSHTASIQSSTTTPESQGHDHEPNLRTWSIPRPNIQPDSAPDGQSDAPNLTPRAPPILPRFCTVKNVTLPVDDLDLGSLPESDFAEYARSVASVRTCLLREAWLPLCPVAVENDESLAFPAASTSSHLVLQQQLADEAIEAAADAMTPINPNMGLSLPPGRPICITPPLSPVSSSEPASPFIPGPDGSIVDLVSEASSPVPPLVQQLQSQLRYGGLDSDVAAPPTTVTTSPLLTCLDYELGQTSIADLIVDVPLSAVNSDPPSANETLTAIRLPVMPDSSDSTSHEEICDKYFDDALVTFLDSRRSELSAILDHEQLCSYDTNSRIPVPSVDTETPEAQGPFDTWTARQHLSKLLVGSYALMGHLVTSISQTALLDSELRWNPLPRGVGKLSLHEELTQASASQQDDFLEDRPWIQVLTMRDSIRIKATEDPEPELSDVSEPATDDTLACHTTETDIRQLPLDISRAVPQQPTGFPTVGHGEIVDDNCPRSLHAEDISSTARLLNDFIALRGVKRRRLSGSKTLGQGPTRQAAQPQLSATRHRQQSVPQHQKEPRRAPQPVFEIPDQKGPCIVSLTLDRSIIRQLETYLPPELLVDRDFSLLGADRPFPEAGTQGQYDCLAAIDADVCLTPTMGLIATSLVKVRQKPLPGSQGRAPLRDRIYNASLKYETLIVLVSESNMAGEFSGSLSPSDLASYADFARFANSLCTRVPTFLVPGANGTLAQWILAFLCHCSTGTASLANVITLEESPWELFFRRAGLNAMSAQIISKSLLAEYGNSGLAEFLDLPMQMKIAKYGTVLGGHKALARCSRLLGRSWL
ncbi:hypothetical protein JDV02_000153 [Purpureocillium takamizusanense]|uniref:Uncharacterized protein n=1 Tax=Purpureocillium takamizusanense TaxID=2060973 RepID=A0A9Q8Q5J8_9HYPO|nr:uncharacterized protein JDV02_000153 [Purpureocillium takamizusanense]UNI13405.1 hypothetical protein JDV02_000153 [Purpureocillium takamizusanense]